MFNMFSPQNSLWCFLQHELLPDKVFFEFKNGEHHSKDWCIKTKKICMPYWNGGHLVIYSSTTDGWTFLGASLGLPGYTFPGFNKSLTWAQPYWSDRTTLNIAYTAYIREARSQLGFLKKKDWKTTFKDIIVKKGYCKCFTKETVSLSSLPCSSNF